MAGLISCPAFGYSPLFSSFFKPAPNGAGVRAHVRQKKGHLACHMLVHDAFTQKIALCPFSARMREAYMEGRIGGQTQMDRGFLLDENVKNALRKGLRVVGDVHGDLQAFRHAIATDRFIIQLGDLVDYGPDSAGVLRAMMQVMKEGRGLFLIGNHDRKLGRALMGRKLRPDPPLEATLSQLYRPDNQDVLSTILPYLEAAPAWIVLGRKVFVHGAFDVRMLMEPPPPALGRVTFLLSRALFGETTNRVQKDGYPERCLNWVNHIPTGYTVYCGHDQRSTNGCPLTIPGRTGGEAIFTDTGAGKGGHLAWLDLPADFMEEFSIAL